jgi:hypothetical protein
MSNIKRENESESENEELYENETDKFGRNFCGCSYYFSVLVKKPKTNHKGIINIINSKNVSDLNEDGLELILHCLYYLYLVHLLDLNRYNNSYKVLYSFLYDHLKIKGGYAYWIMNWLDWNNLTTHGSGIRCSWIDDDGIKFIKPHLDKLKNLHYNNILLWSKSNNED